MISGLLGESLQKQTEKVLEELREIQNLRHTQEMELKTIENAALRQRFQLALDKLIAQEQDKQDEVI